jgi:hypothetical protein
MKSKLMTLVATAAIAVAGSAQARINDDNIPGMGSNTFSGMGGVGEVFVSIIARDPGNPANNRSYVGDLGIPANVFVNALNSGNLALVSYNIAPTATLQTFLANNMGKQISYNVTAVHNGPDFDPNTFEPVDVGYLTSSPLTADQIAALQPVGFGEWNNATIAVDSFINSVNLVHGGTFADNNSATFLPGQAGFHDNNWGHAVVFGFETEGNSPVDFFFIGFENGNSNASRHPDLLGFWNLLPDGTLTFSAIPIPAAAWLFGSALLGLVGVARRQSA